jgi:hypothetical protein
MRTHRSGVTPARPLALLLLVGCPVPLPAAGRPPNVVLPAKQPAKAAELRAKLAAWRREVGAQENAPNPAFDAALHRKLYVETDVSRLRPAATAAVTAEPLRAWRRAMDAAVRMK